jgi:prepilin-type N-terminal cleavage/methylation domain-containing protein
MMHKLPNRTNDGFTLIELLVVIVMVGILAAIAAPSWLTFMSSRRINTANDQVLQAIRQAQAQSTRSKRSQTVVFNTTANPPTITVLGGTNVLGDGAFKPNMVSMVIRNGAISTNCPNTSCLEFDANGNVVNLMNAVNAPSIKIAVFNPSNTSSQRCVIVETLLGAMRSGKNADCN